MVKAIPLPHRLTVDELKQDDTYDLEELSNKAATELGYTELRNKIQTQIERQKIIEFLGVKDLLPFRPEEVEQYKATQLRREQRFFDVLNTEQACFLSTVLTILSIIMGTVAIVLFTTDHPLAGSSLAVLILLPAWLGCRLYERSESKITRAEWKRSLISGYSRPVPEYVLSTAVELNERFPGGSFFIEELQPRTAFKQTHVQYDPFLVWSYQGETYYLEVWNEPHFQGQRQT